MLSIHHPVILHHLADFSYGLMPVFLPKENRFILTLKATKEVILTARMNDEFKIYLMENTRDDTSHLGIITAFFDDHDEPLVLKTPLFYGDDLLKDITHVFSQEYFDLYFFDEHNRELMGVKVFNKEYERFKAEMSLATFPEFNSSEVLALIRRMDERFSVRDEGDDARVFTISFVDRLYPDDFYIIDARDESYQFEGASSSVALTSLERDVEPGPMQERDIASMMERVFDSQSIYLNPIRLDTGKELTDILVVTDCVMLFVQAKDSPNTEETLKRSIDRKRKTIRSHIKKASNQVRGALNYAKNNDGITINSDCDPITIPKGDRQLVGLIVVREMFDDDYLECSTPVLKVVFSLEKPVILLDFPGLQLMTQHLRNPVRFINAMFDMLDVAIEYNEFPKPGWSGISQQSD
jgi:hypothetical protein